MRTQTHDMVGNLSDHLSAQVCVVGLDQHIN